MRYSIKIKLTLVIVGCIILVSLAIGITSSLLMEKYLLRQASARLYETAKFISMRTNNFINSREKGIDILSKNKTISLFLKKQDKVDITQVKDLFQGLAHEYSVLVLVDKTGRVVVKSNNGVEFAKWIKRDNSSKFIRAMKNNSLLSEFSSGDSTYKIGDIDFYKRVLGANGEPVGVVFGEINYSNFYDMLKKNYVDSEFALQIYDNKNKVVLCGYSEAWSKDRLTSSSIVKDMNWTVEVALSYEVFEENLYTLRFYTFLITLTVVILGVILSILVSYRLSKPILFLAEATNSISNGDLTSRIILNSKDELGQLAGSFNKMTISLKYARDQMEIVHKHTIHMVALASEYKDTETHDHITRVVDMTTEFALELGMEPELAAKIGADSILHDLGKLGVADYILLKPGKLNDNEFEAIKLHTTIGARILGDHEWFHQAREIALYHHEKWDGSGYPEGLSGSDIPLAARIVAVADVFDVLISKRPYKDPWKMELAANEIVRLSGKHFDPEIVDAFESLYKKGSLNKYHHES